METRFGPVNVTHSARGVPTYSVELFHDGLHKHSLIKAADPSILKNKGLAQALQWDDAWRRQSAAEERIRRTFEKKEARRLHIEHQKELALERTNEAQQLLECLSNALISGIQLDPTLDWEELKDRTAFPLDAPRKPRLEPEPVKAPTPPAPDRSAQAYSVALSLLDRMIPSWRQAKRAAAKSRFDVDLRAWEDACAALDAGHRDALDVHLINRNRLLEEYAQARSKWETQKLEYDQCQAEQHSLVDAFRKRYESKDEDAVLEYFERVVSKSEYPDCIRREFEFELNTETGVLLVNCRLPAPDDVPKLAEIKYVQTSDALVERYLSDAQSARLYEDLLYKITLRTVHELFQTDSMKTLSTIVFNGIVTSTDRSTGNEVTACILSVQVPRDPFLAINLAKVDPKACFRQLRGVGSSKLHSITPVAPIVELKRHDPRFVSSHPVAEGLSEGFNLAMMDWEEFEHLIREIFEKEFSSNGGEVKVTQASRDGGVDAVAFDPDPIRGGKIVIQAKRYAYTVGVSAVRDLYGTVLNEGASKGILVTTSDYGPDAYEFANGKPITLLSGSNLLHLLGRHGVSAHINLTEARIAAHERSTRTHQ
jgi:restriction system protein